MVAANDTSFAQHCPDPRLDEAIAYVLAVPGKRLRSRLTREIALMLQPDDDTCAATAAACGEAIELLHTYSLIHDDLPSMDDDDLRRGRATLHRAFDEATAILAGDGLQALAFERLATIDALSPEARLELIRVVSRAVGLHGMVGGQALDLAAEGASLSREALGQLHALKTGALIEAAVEAGAICAGADSTIRERLRGFAQSLGLAFQVVDDVLDATASSNELGKTAGKDSAAGKSTYVSHLGVDGARAEADRLLALSIAALEPWGEAAEPVQAIARNMVERRA
jgi:geranylgeranyl pyrophosphate synthase